MTPLTTMTVHVDTSDLDTAIKKARTLLELQERVHVSGSITGPAVVAAGLALSGHPRKVTRRGLLGLGWLSP